MMLKNNKIKFLKILEILRSTDEFHPLNAAQIVIKLNSYGIEAERKSVLRDIHCLEEAGYTIILSKNHNEGFFMIDQQFEDYELKILSDAVKALDVLTEKDTNDLSKKIISLATEEGKQIINANTYADNLSKSEDHMNKIKIDTIIRAIKERRKISFQYYEYSVEGKNKLKRNGYTYIVSPYYLILKDREYFLIGNVDTNDGLTYFRIEMILNIQESNEDRKRKELIEEFKNNDDEMFQVTDFMKRKVHFQSGEKKDVKLKCKDSVIKYIEKQFGKEIWMKPLDDGTFYCRVKVEDSIGFYQWIASFGIKIKIISPESVIENYKKYIREIMKSYIN